MLGQITIIGLIIAVLAIVLLLAERREKAWIACGLYFEHDWTSDGDRRITRKQRADWYRKIAGQLNSYVDTLYNLSRSNLTDQPLFNSPLSLRTLSSIESLALPLFQICNVNVTAVFGGTSLNPSLDSSMNNL